MVVGAGQTRVVGCTSVEIRKTLPLVPQMLIINTGFNVYYNAMNNAYPSQACQMSIYFFGGGVQFNGAITNFGVCIATIVGVPIVEGCIFPIC